MKNRQIVFARRPEGEVTAEVFAERETGSMPVGDGEILCRNLVASIDPYLRLKMYNRRSYTPPLEIGQLIPGRTIAQVIESRSPKFQPGDHVAIGGGWQQYAAVPADTGKRVDLQTMSAGAWLGPMGMTGLTAYAGLMQVGQPKSGETLVVSGAGGAVGGIVGQIGKIMGCRVVGIAGTDDKCRTVREAMGFDDCVNYRDPQFEAKLASSLTDGCDIYFDNVGGMISRAVAQHLNDFARIPLCGLISQYDGQNAAEPTAFDEFTRLILTRRLMLRGFIVTDIASGSPDFEPVMARWLLEGKLKHSEHLLEGFEMLVPAFLGVLNGENTGKSIVQIEAY